MTSNPSSRQPPRFVPTLTDVVDVVAPAAATPSFAHSAQNLSAESARTLTESPFSAPPSATSDAEKESLQTPDALRTRVVARVQANLQERLHATLTDVVQQLHSQTLYKVMRAEIDAMVVNAVQDALTQELERLKRKP